MAKMIYLTSDTFFGRHNSSKQRGFETSEDMDQVMIDKWNSKINENDIVWHLGNFAWDIISAENALVQLNGNINLIMSEIDLGLKEIYDTHNVVQMHGYYILESKGCVLSHWPMVNWPAKNHSTPSLHIHGNNKEYKSDLNKENRFNVNCELWSLEPVSLESLKEITQMVKEQDC